VIHVEHEEEFQVEPMCILYRKVKFLKNKLIGLVKVQWTCYDPKDAMWEHKKTMQKEHLQCFVNFEEN
jgi:hypothetical protein